MDKSSLFQSWKNAVLANPEIHITIRLENIKALLRIGHPNGYYIWGDVLVEKYKKIGITYKKIIYMKLHISMCLRFKRALFFLGGSG